MGWWFFREKGREFFWGENLSRNAFGLYELDYPNHEVERAAIRLFGTKENRSLV